ncbi:unnamed protein product [Ixodes hexagonus]
MSPVETKKAKRRKNKKVARSPAKDPIEGVGMSTRVGSANPSSHQNEKDADPLGLPPTLTSACGPKESPAACIICSKPYPVGSPTGCENKDGVDFFGPEAVWVCSECRDNLPSEELLGEDIDLSALRDGTLPKELLSMADELEASACMCEPYPGWRAPEAEVVREQQELRQCWQGVKQALHHAYQQAGLSLGEALARQVAAFRDERATPSEAEVRDMVSRLRRRDPHRLLQCLKYQAQLFIVESRLRMLHHVVASTTTTATTTSEGSHGSRLEDSLVAEYTKLRHAWEHLNPLLEELVTLDLNKYGLSWELVNKYLFQAIVYSDPAIHKCLPDLLTQKHSVKFKQDHKALLELDSEMALTTIIWRKVQQLLDEPVQFELATLPKQQQMLQAQWERLASGWKSLDPEFLAKTAGLLAGDLAAEECSGTHERHACCLATSGPEAQCPFAEVGLLGAAGESAAMAHRLSTLALHKALWTHGGDSCGPGVDPAATPVPPEASAVTSNSLKKARLRDTTASEACECHACTTLQWPPSPALPLPPPSQQPLIHPHLYGSPGMGRTINLELESLDTLQQQAYLATLGDWDDPHYKFGTAAHPRHPGSESPQLAAPTTKPSSGLPPAPRGSPPPASTHRHAQQGACLDSDCDNTLLDGEDSMDDTCSEHSSSTTASNQRGAGESRVCDCCYCEVFGHGTPPVAPVSKNYQEMRDRLRLILSKRKVSPAGKVMRTASQSVRKTKKAKDGELLDVCVTYGGTWHKRGHTRMLELPSSKSTHGAREFDSSHEHRKFAKPREDCDKAKEVPESKSHSPSPISRLIEAELEESKATLPPPKAVLNRKEARKENGIRLSKCPQNSSSNNNNASSCSSNSCVVSIAELGDKVRPSLGSSPCPRVSSGSATNPVSNGRTPTTSISGNVFIIGGPSLPSGKFHLSDLSLEKGDASKMAAEKTELTVKAVAAAAAPSQNLFKKLSQNGPEAEVTVTALPSNHQRSSVSEILPTVKKDLCITHQLNGAQAKSKKSRKKKNSSTDVTSPDDVFLPKDIDLENGDLDELEREVEAFKRFCFNSVPVANKEKVHVNLKDILQRRKQSSAAMLSQGLMQRT